MNDGPDYDDIDEQTRAYLDAQEEEDRRERDQLEAYQEHQNAQYVSDTLKQRLEDLGWNQQDLVRKSGVSATTIRWLQTAEVHSYRAGTLSKVSKALGWPAGALAKMLAGQIGVPEPTHDPSLDDDPAPPVRPPVGEPAALSGKIAKLTPAQRAAVEAIVDEMLPGDA